MTRDEADTAQDWASLDGGQAFALIERHAADHQEAHEMMEAWKRAHVKAEREACAELCDAHWMAASFDAETAKSCAAVIRARPSQ